MNISDFKNDAQRREFLEGYYKKDSGFEPWKGDGEIGIRWWKIDFDNGLSIIVEERMQTVEKSRRWICHDWYIVRDWSKPIWDQRGCITNAVAALKAQRKGARR